MITSPRRPRLMAASANPAGEAGTSGYRSSSGIAAMSTAEWRWPLSALCLPPSVLQLAISGALGSARCRAETDGKVASKDCCKCARGAVVATA